MCSEVQRKKMFYLNRKIDKIIHYFLFKNTLFRKAASELLPTDFFDQHRFC